MDDLKIIVNVFYEPVDDVKSIIDSHKDIYIPINGGSKLTDDWSKANLIMDNIGDNISDKNNILNEMTSIYWFWKNYKDLDKLNYVGFNHYRRFFKLDDIKDYHDYDMILGRGITFKISLYKAYDVFHELKDLNTLIEILTSKNEYMGKLFKKYTQQNLMVAPCNMFILKKELFIKWCEFIFDILNELEQKINLDDGRDTYQKRALCFLTERLFGFWVTYMTYNSYKSSIKLKSKFIPIEYHKEYKTNSSVDAIDRENFVERRDKLMFYMGKSLNKDIEKEYLES